MMIINLEKGNKILLMELMRLHEQIKTRIKLLKGEWWESTKEGLPLFQKILGQSGNNENLAIADSLIKERIVDTPDVLSITRFNSNYENRNYSFNCSVSTKYGEIEISLTL